MKVKSRSESPEEFHIVEQVAQDDSSAREQFDVQDVGEDETATMSVPDDDIPNAGWRAWLVVLGGFCANSTTFGFANSTGTIQEHLLSHTLSDKSESTVGWIFSIYIFSMMLGGIQAGPLVDTVGVEPLLMPSCILWSSSSIILSFCKEYYQFISGFSVLGGISSSFIFNPSYTVINQWFTTKKPLAMSLVALGSSISGCFLPVVLGKSFDSVGYGWTIRILAFVVMGLSVIACVTMKGRTKRPQKITWHDVSVDLRSLKDSNFRWCVLGLCLVEWAFFMPAFYIVDYARSVLNYSNQDANLLLVYQNISSTVGRLLGGYCGRSYGTFSSMIAASALAGLSASCIWIPSGHNKAAVILFNVIFGLGSGAGMALGPSCVAVISTSSNFGKRYGTTYAFVSIAVITSLPIGGALTAHDYIGSKLTAGLAYSLSSVCYIMVSSTTYTDSPWQFWKPRISKEKQQQ